jgi:predicted alpha-1,2-mannosidase
MTTPIDFVNPLQGTNNRFDFSHGNCMPLASVPHAMTSWTLQTSDSGWAFNPNDKRVQGFRATRMPSPWIGDYGHFTLMAQVGEPTLSADARSSSYHLSDTVIQPHYQRVHLLRYQTTMEIAPTQRCAMLRVTYPSTTEAAFIVQPFAGDSAISVDTARQCITGYTQAHTAGCPPNFACYFVIAFDQPITGAMLFDVSHAWEAMQGEGERIGARVAFDATASRVLNVRVGTSFVSIEQAWRNLESEIGTSKLEKVREQSKNIWNELLSRIEIDGATEAQRHTFYSCLYRTLLFPRQWHEIDDAGDLIHFSPYSGNIEKGLLSTDNGFWDTFRTEYPLLALVYPDVLNSVLEGWLNAYREGGWFPKWASPAYRDCMIGTHLDVVFADAILRGVDQYDVELAYEAMRKDAFEPTHTGEYGREAIASYIELGYCPIDPSAHGSAARTQEYAYDDFCVAQVARLLGNHDDASHLYQRSFNYKNVFDPSVGFMRGRFADGSWVTPFNPFAWDTRAYVEGSAWQYSWAVQHDPAGLIALHGGPAKFVRKLDSLFTTPAHFVNAGYPYEIHEMTEMAAVDFGQYAHSNQPVHHVLALYAAAGQPWKMQYWARRVMNELYDSGVNGFCGDEDNGSMSSWYVLNALGLMPLCPGHPTFVLGSPLFTKSVVHLNAGRDLTIEAKGNSAGKPYVQSMAWNRKPHESTWITHEVLAQGGALRFSMGATPLKRRYTKQQLPFSLSTSGLLSL